MDIIWIWICSQRPAANLLLSQSANIGAHSDFSNDPKAKWCCNTAKTANMDLLVQHVMTHLAKCCQESFNYLNSKINCCGCRAKSSTVLLLAFQILWKISLWTGILPQADRAQHGFTELTVYWDIASNKIETGMIRPQGTFEPSSDWSLNKVAACVSCDHMWSPNCFSDSANSTIDKLASFYDTTLLAPTYPNHFGCNLGPKHLLPTSSSTLLVSFVPLVSQAGAACRVYSCWETYDMPTCVDGPENHLIPKPTALLVHVLRRFSDGGLVAACSVLLQMISQPAAQELLKGFSYLLLGTSRFGILAWY